MNTGRLTIAIYLRISDEDKDMEGAAKRESDSIANQRNLLRGFLRGLPEAGKADILEFCDDGCSGKNFDRPSVRALLKKAEQGEIYCIVVKDDCVILELNSESPENTGLCDVSSVF